MGVVKDNISPINFQLITYIIITEELTSTNKGKGFEVPSTHLLPSPVKCGGVLMFYINQNILCKKIDFPVHILYRNTLEINLGKEKLLIFGTYKPPNINFPK